MSANKVYHSVSAQNVKSTDKGSGHKPFDTIDFLLDFEGRKAQLNTFRLEGDVRFYSTGTTVLLPSVIGYIDHQTGIHSVIDSMTVELVQGGGMIENISADYGRYVKMISQATKTSTDMLNADDIASLKAYSSQSAREVACGELHIDSNGGVNGGATTTVNDNSFSFKPMFCLNNANTVVGGNTLSYRKSGTVKVSITLQRNANVFFGGGVDANFNYELCNLKMYFCSVPDDGQDQPLQLRTLHALKHQVVSGNSQVKAKVPAVCVGVSSSFLQQTNENDLTANALACERPPEIASVEFNFNDNTNRFISYSIEREKDLLSKYLESLGSSGNNEVNSSALSNNDGFGLGVSFDSPVDLSQTQFNTVLRSGLNANLPYVMFQYFHGVLNL